jgi:hypothetical protein
LRSILDSAYNLMIGPGGDGPRPLDRMLDLAIQAATEASDQGIQQAVRASMIADDPNDPVRGLFGQMLRNWDFAGTRSWTAATEPNTPERRAAVYRLLGLTAAEIAAADERIPFADLRNTNIVIAETHGEWYVGERRRPGFYWKEYRKYLESSGWEPDSLNDLSEASDLILERISDPFRSECYQTKGIVVGYVQSGKTANFTAVVTKAADAGYRLIIVFGGVLDILRAQTQRRIDKELVGQELLAAGVREGAAPEYLSDTDWNEFAKHGALPSKLGHFDIERLTGFRDDYQSFRRHISGLEFRGQYEDRRYNHPDNIRQSPVRLVVMKKIPSRIAALRKDLQSLKHTALDQIPTLIIDDESDQASINTRNPNPTKKSSRSPSETGRAPTNREILNLMNVLPRAQYVGYTATPFANVFVDPNDAADLFPKDFLVALKRPAGYMGVREFFDFDRDGRALTGDERPEGYHSNERAFLRDIRRSEEESEDAKDRRNLRLAIDSFVLSGAMKLFRAARGTGIRLRHHTMLVHRSTARTDHLADRNLVIGVFNSGGYGTAASFERLRQLWDMDFKPVCDVKANGLPVPNSFVDLQPHVEAAVGRIRSFGGDHGPARIVNAEPGMEEQVPEFDREDVWSILVGGAKLSRGFTVEGLTISYFRRRTKTADTLMQTGRWFGFRRGYMDLVRVFLGRDEPDGKGATFDLLEAFKAICLDEEVFRAQLRRYIERRDGMPPITPKQIPPLVPKHLLQPTATNKMYNAKVEFVNFGGDWKESTPLPTEGPPNLNNTRKFRTLIEGLRFERVELGVTDPDDAAKQIRWQGLVARTGPLEVLSLLDSLEWLGETEGYADERRFLHGTGELDPGIAHWFIIAPQQVGDVSNWTCGAEFKVVVRPLRRDAKGNMRFGVFSERRHRPIAEAITGAKRHIGLTAATQALLSEKTAVLMLYPTVAANMGKRDLHDGDVTMGFGLQFPPNAIRRLVVFGVRNAERPDDVVVSDASVATGLI